MVNKKKFSVVMVNIRYHICQCSLVYAIIRIHFLFTDIIAMTIPQLELIKFTERHVVYIFSTTGIYSNNTTLVMLQGDAM